MNSNFKNPLIFIVLTILSMSCSAQKTNTSLLVGAEQAESYLDLLKNKKVGLMVNQTSFVEDIHLLDFLLNKDIKVVKVFAAEHGFRGQAANGEEVNSSIDSKTGIPIISLYGKKKKADSIDLVNVDLLIFDIQDVGCRFYTYISSMLYAMEACAENKVEFVVLDRPNPNGDYIDGPVLDLKLKSFVGMIPIPIIHGCTVGELAKMINGEHWLSDSLQCHLKVIPVKNYTHATPYSLPISPSPNLPNDLSIRLYPSLCFFEATNVSIGRGTHFPFQVIGYPGNPTKNFSFTPVSIEGMSKYPLHENIECFGIDLRKTEAAQQFTLNYFIEYFQLFENQDKFWKSKRWINLLSGDSNFYTQINNGLTESEIKKTWQKNLNTYKKLRKKYLLYPDFE